MKKKVSIIDRFASRKSFLEAGLLKGFTDVHTHYLPAVDDGFRQAEGAIEALKTMVSLGVKRVWMTPHVMEDIPQNRPAFLKERFAGFVPLAPEGIELRLAAEYMLDGGFQKQQEEGLLTLGGNHVLIEMSYMAASPSLLNVVYDLQIKGYKPLLAHPERYLYLREADYLDLKEKGCRFQLNLMSLSGQYGQESREVAWYLLQNGMYDFVGSDIHNLQVFMHNVNRMKLTLKEQKLIQELSSQNDLLWDKEK